MRASFETCVSRDVKGLYAKAAEGKVEQFTGRDSLFEEPLAEDENWIVDTEAQTVDESLDMIFKRILPLVQST